MKQFLLFLAMAVMPASAQWGYFGSEPLRPTGFFGVGFSTPVNPLANRLDAGWNLAGGMGVTQTYVGVTVDAMFNDFGITHAALVQARARSGSQKYWALTVDPIFHVNDRGPVDFYVSGGAGLYGRITKYRASSTAIGPGFGQFDLVSSDQLYRPGVNLGVGFAFNLSDRSNIKIFAEARYHHMFTPGSASSFIPVTVGVRF
jgi:hypothetical protein